MDGGKGRGRSRKRGVISFVITGGGGVGIVGVQGGGELEVLGLKRGKF